MRGICRMGEETKERKCIFCGKKLLDERLPLCLRCRLEGRNTVVKVGKTAGTIVLAVGGAQVIKDNNGRDTV